MLKSVIKGVLLGALIFVLFSLAAPAGLSQKEIFRRGASQTFRMLNPNNVNSGGTGFVAKMPSGANYIVTNAHVCGVNASNFMIAERDKRMVRVPIIEVASDTDLCITIAPPGYEGLEIGEEVNLLQQVYVVGHPRLEPISIQAGWIRARETVPISYCSRYRGKSTRMFAIPMMTDVDALFEEIECIKDMDSYVTNAYVAPGNSGSAALSDEGKVVGVVFAGDSMGTSLLVPLDRLKRFLAAY